MNRFSRISARFRDLPIRRKLRITFIVTTAAALLLAGLGIVTADSFMFYRFLERDLATFVQIIGANSTGALAFDDPNAATETLAALRARSHVETACLYQQTGTLLAQYARSGYHGGCPAIRQANLVRFEHGSLVASQQIQLAGRIIGVLVLQYDLREILDRIELYGFTVLVALLLSCIATLALSSRLRALIAEPILDLAGTARLVSQKKDYSIRAAKRSQDELGALADALNQMMEGIQSRDNDLRKALEDQRVALDRLAQLNADLRRSNTELALSNSDLERFAFMASHDLQEPLRMITSYTQLLVSQHSKNDGGNPAAYVEYITGGTKRMRELLADLLAYTEIAGTVDQPVEPVDLNSVMKEVQRALSARIEESQTQITVQPLPLLNAHGSRMISLFQNLIENAIKYRGDRPPRILISLEERENQFTFSVSDNGIGIENGYYEKIFVAFQRLHGKEVPGTGIGLAICQRVVERYGGRIWVESKFGEGSTFRFTLPRSMAEGLAKKVST